MGVDIHAAQVTTSGDDTSNGAGTIFIPGNPPFGLPTFDGVPSGDGLAISSLTGLYDGKFNDISYYAFTG